MKAAAVLLFLLSPLLTIAQWEKVAWDGAWVPSLLQDGSDLICATGIGGVYRSTNNGNSWVPFNEGIATNHYALFAREIIATPDYFLLLSEAPRGDRQFFRRSKTGGIWEHLPTMFDSAWIGSAIHVGGDTIVVSAENFNQGIEGDRNGIYITTNSGTSWEKRTTGLPTQLLEIEANYQRTTLCVSALQYDSTTIEYSSIGVYVSTNLGQSWSQVADALSDSLFFTILATNGSTFFAEGYLFDGTDFLFDGIYRSRDNGSTWERSMTGIDVAEEYVVSFTPFEGQMIVSMSANNYLSTDNGATWEQFLADYFYLSFYDAHRINGKILLATYSGIYIPNGELTAATDVAYSADGFLAYRRAGCYAEGEQVYANPSFDLPASWTIESYDNGESWQYISLNPSITMSSTRWIHSKGSYFAGGRNEESGRAAILIADDLGSFWYLHSTLPRPGYVCGFDIKGDSILAGITDENDNAYVYFSTNMGTTWKAQNTRLNSAENFPIVRFVGDQLFVTDQNGHASLSDDGGTSWHDPFLGTSPYFFTTGFVATDAYAVAVGNAIDYERETIVPEVYVSKDHGLTWELTSTAIPSGVVLDDAIVDEAQGVIYVSTDPTPWVYSSSPATSQVFVSTDQAKTWTPFQDQLPQAYRLLVGGSYLYAQNDHGLYRVPKVVSAVTGATSIASKPSITAMPNPVHEQVTVAISLPGESAVVISLFDALGTELQTLVSGRYVEGTHEIQCTLPRIPSGAYYLRMTSDFETASTLLIKQ